MGRLWIAPEGKESAAIAALYRYLKKIKVVSESPWRSDGDGMNSLANRGSCDMRVRHMELGQVHLLPGRRLRGACPGRRD